MREISCSRPAPIRLVPFSYFCTCWNVKPMSLPSSVWLISSIIRRMRTRLPTCLSVEFGDFLGMRIVYNARWHLSTRTSPDREKSVIYHERGTHFRDPGLYVETASRKQLPGAVEMGLRQQQQISAKKACRPHSRASLRATDTAARLSEYTAVACRDRRRHTGRRP